MKRTVDLVQKKKAIWAKREREVGFPLGQPFRDAVEKLMGSDVDDTYLEDLDANIPAYVRLASTFAPSSQGVRDRAKSEPRKTYHKPFERRFHLAEFVTENAKDYSGRIRFKWQLIADQWNMAYPFESISPEVLRVEYCRAIQDDALLRQLITTKLLGVIGDAVGSYVSLHVGDNEAWTATKILDTIQKPFTDLVLYVEGGPSKDTSPGDALPEGSDFFRVLAMKRRQFVVEGLKKLPGNTDFRSGLELIADKVNNRLALRVLFQLRRQPEKDPMDVLKKLGLEKAWRNGTIPSETERYFKKKEAS